MNTALFRDYSMLAASYMLENCHHTYLRSKNYGEGMSSIPAKLAVPLKLLADRLHYKQPLLDYAHAYALYNWKMPNDPNPEATTYNNDDIVTQANPIADVELIRKFHGCDDERGFILIHVAIVSRTHKQVAAYDTIYEGLKNQDRDMVNKGLEMHHAFLTDIRQLFANMWKYSAPVSYLNFRTFIMGITGNDDIFPNGVIYEGCFDNKPQYYRGETGAQDSIIPATDSALGLEYPQNQLTEYLFQLRDYRPFHHQSYIEELKGKANQYEIKNFCLQDDTSSYLLLANQKLSAGFRHQHWAMVKKYIIDNIKYPKATGGTPITTWLPNQLGASLEMCRGLI